MRRALIIAFLAVAAMFGMSFLLWELFDEELFHFYNKSKETIELVE